MFAPLKDEGILDLKSNIYDPSQEKSDAIVKRMQEGTRTAQYDFRIFDEIREMKKELREKKAVNNLMKLFRKANT